MKTGLLWVSFHRDVEWFRLSAKSFRKFATGFDWAKCVVPTRDAHLFKPICDEFGIYHAAWEEWTGLGFNDHQRMKCYADHHLPEAEVIFHIDSDCVFAQPCTPADWIRNGKILLPYTPYKMFLKEPLAPDEMKNFMGYRGRVMDFNRGQLWWKFAVDWALGCDEERECMAWMPIAHHRDVYPKLRSIIAARFPELGFDGYVKQCRNEHPQSFAELNTMGAVAHQYFEDRYEWWDLSSGQYPFTGKVIQSYSRAPMDKKHNYGPQVPTPEIDCPRTLFQHLGLI